MAQEWLMRGSRAVLLGSKVAQEWLMRGSKVAQIKCAGSKVAQDWLKSGSCLLCREHGWFCRAPGVGNPPLLASKFCCQPSLQQSFSSA